MRKSFVKDLRKFLWCLLALVPMLARAGAPGAGSITPNFKDANIRQIIQAVSAATGKDFILDPRVNAQVTMYSSTPLTAGAFYQAFLSILEVYGYIAVPAGPHVVKIIPNANERVSPQIDLPKRVSSTSDELVTQVIPVKNVSAAELVPILRPLVPEWGHLAAYPPSNILIISDRASNVYRIMRIVKRIDRVGNQDVDVMPLQNASATQVVQVVNQLYQGQAAAQMGRTFKVVADPRTNSVLISGDPAERLRIRALVAELDTPSAAGGDTRVVYLHYASAKALAPKLKEQMQELAQISTAGNIKGTVQAAAEKNALVWADTQNNALVITAPPKVMRTILGIVAQLDIRRPQVLVQAIIAEVDVNKTDDLGVNWAAYSPVSKLPLGGFVEPVGGTSIVDLVDAAKNPANLTTSLLEGTTVGIGTVSAGGISFAAMLRALRGNNSTNIVATPSAVTMDNQQAVLKSVDEVPFVTGQYTNASTVTSGTVTPFQTVQREEVGTILKVTPTISATGHAVMLKISVESSSVLPNSVSTVDPTTQKRSITTNVLIENKGVVVLGGLIENSQSRNHSGMPYLGSIPVLGWLFKARNDQAQRSNLMIFIKPTILRDQREAARESGANYRYMLEQEGALPPHQFPPLLYGEPTPSLPPLSAAPPTPAPKAHPRGAPAARAPAPAGAAGSPAPPAQHPPQP